MRTHRAGGLEEEDGNPTGGFEEDLNFQSSEPVQGMSGMGQMGAMPMSSMGGMSGMGSMGSMSSMMDSMKQMNQMKQMKQLNQMHQMSQMGQMGAGGQTPMGLSEMDMTAAAMEMAAMMPPLPASMLYHKTRGGGSRGSPGGAYHSVPPPRGMGFGRGRGGGGRGGNRGARSQSTPAGATRGLSSFLYSSCINWEIPNFLL